MLPNADPDFKLTVNGNPFSGWTSMEINRSLERMGGEFHLELTRKGSPTQIDTGIAAGQACEVMIGEQLVLKGYIDTLNPSYDETMTRIRVSGRDAVGDLIDCAASVDGPFEFTGLKLEQLFERILKPHNIPLTVSADTGAPFKRIAIQPGETAYELIERVCRYRALLPLSDGIGGLLIVKPGTIRSAGNLVYGQNILSADASYDMKDRFSLYVVKGQGEAQSESTAEETASGEGRASDALVKRYRPTIIIGENQGFDGTLKQRAEWQAQFARARSVKYSCTVQGWYADATNLSLWLCNTIVPVRDTILGIERDMLISGVTYRRSEQGTTTGLELALPEAFNLPADIEPESTDVAGEA